LSAIFSLSTIPLLLTALVFVLLSLGLSLLMLEWSRRRFAGDARSLPVAPFFTAITTVWALSLGFVAADLWSLRSSAEQAASAERSSVSRLLGMAAPDALDLPALRDALGSYSAAVRDNEWGDAGNAVPTPQVEGSLQAMRLALVELSRQATPLPLIAKMTQDFDELQDARNTRLAIGKGSVNVYKWYLVLALTALSMLAVASVHADRPAAGRTALVIFAAASVISLWILAVHANPYTGGAAIPFAPPAATGI
jgi:hypothetical protein